MLAKPKSNFNSQVCECRTTDVNYLPQIFMGASSSSKMGWEMKISLER